MVTKFVRSRFSKVRTTGNICLDNYHVCDINNFSFSVKNNVFYYSLINCMNPQFMTINDLNLSDLNLR